MDALDKGKVRPHEPDVNCLQHRIGPHLLNIPHHKVNRCFV